jgi:hypothetical protein
MKAGKSGKNIQLLTFIVLFLFLLYSGLITLKDFTQFDLTFDDMQNFYKDAQNNISYG